MRHRIIFSVITILTLVPGVGMTQISWNKYPANPVIDIGANGGWDDAHVSHPSVLFDGSEYHIVSVFPSVTRLLPNYPNPFNPETGIPYELAEDALVEIEIYDAAGQLVHTLNLGVQQRGRYINRAKAAYWDGRTQLCTHAASGLYFYMLKVREAIPRIGAGNFIATRKMVIVK